MATVKIWGTHNDEIVASLTYNDNNLSVQSATIQNTSSRTAFIRIDSGTRTVEISIEPFDTRSVNVPGNSGVRFVEAIDPETQQVVLRADFFIYCRSG